MKGRIVAAFILLVVGVAWTLDLLGWPLFPGGLGVWWPSILILVGTIQLAFARRQWHGPVLLIAAGAVLQAWRLGYLPPGAWRFAAPAALVLLAVFLLLPRRGAEASGERKPGEQEPWRTQKWGETSRSKLGPEDVAVFSGHRLDAPAGEVYKGGELTAVFGTLEADLTRATLPPEGARLKATSVLGGVTVRVPPGWRVEMHGTPVFGSATNRTVGPPEGPRLHVDAVAVLGDVSVVAG